MRGLEARRAPVEPQRRVERARPIYDELRKLDGEVVIDAIVAKAGRDEARSGEWS